MTHLVADNQLTLLHAGAAYFPQLIADINSAQHIVYIESYIFAPDQTGHHVLHALLRAALRGVQVRVLLDGFGSANFPAHWQGELARAGAHFQWFRREVVRFKLRRHRLRRLHRKLIAIDHNLAFIGGINIIHEQPPRLDFAVRVQGSMAAEIHRAMCHLWQRVTWAKLGQRGQRVRHSPPVSPTGVLRLLLRDNLRHRRDIERAYLHAIAHAQQEIVLANAYFLPGQVFRRALKQAARRGVRVVLLLQGKVEYRLQHYATHALYGELLEAGIKIYEYQGGYLHAKVAVIDQHWATIGSSNIDPFSLLLAREANIVVQHTEFAKELHQHLQQALQHALYIPVRDWRQLNGFMWLLVWCSYFIVRMLMGVMGIKDEH